MKPLSGSQIYIVENFLSYTHSIMHVLCDVHPTQLIGWLLLYKFLKKRLVFVSYSD